MSSAAGPGVTDEWLRRETWRGNCSEADYAIFYPTMSNFTVTVNGRPQTISYARNGDSFSYSIDGGTAPMIIERLGENSMAMTMGGGREVSIRCTYGSPSRPVQ